MTNKFAFRKFGHVMSAACLALAMTCGSATAADVPLVDGTHWTKSTDDVKKAYLVGLANLVQMEVAYNAKDPLPEKYSFSPRLAKGLTGHSLRLPPDQWIGRSAQGPITGKGELASGRP